jgi:hypothetical protein
MFSDSGNGAHVNLVNSRANAFRNIRYGAKQVIKWRYRQDDRAVFRQGFLWSYVFRNLQHSSSARKEWFAPFCKPKAKRVEYLRQKTGRVPLVVCMP